MRIIALACISLALSTSAIADSVDDDFAAGVRGVLSDELLVRC
jgi:hypothetical protein